MWVFDKLYLQIFEQAREHTKFNVGFKIIYAPSRTKTDCSGSCVLKEHTVTKLYDAKLLAFRKDPSGSLKILSVTPGQIRKTKKPREIIRGSVNNEDSLSSLCF